MSRSRFVQPDLTRLPLSGGDWIDVKKELNSAEHRRVFGRMVKEMVAGERTKYDPEQVGRSKVIEYLLAWSFVDQAGRPVPVSESAVDSLSADAFQEILAAVDAHEERVEAAVEKEKNVQAGETTSSPTSGSPDDAAGATSGSAS